MAVILVSIGMSNLHISILNSFFPISFKIKILFLPWFLSLYHEIKKYEIFVIYYFNVIGFRAERTER